MTYHDGATVKLSAKDIHVLVQALRLGMENGELLEYCSKFYVSQLNERLSKAK
jgi:hypothetical protein